MARICLNGSAWRIVHDVDRLNLQRPRHENVSAFFAAHSRTACKRRFPERTVSRKRRLPRTGFRERPQNPANHIHTSYRPLASRDPNTPITTRVQSPANGLTAPKASCPSGHVPPRLTKLGASGIPVDRFIPITMASWSSSQTLTVNRFREKTTGADAFPCTRKTNECFDVAPRHIELGRGMECRFQQVDILPRRRRDKDDSALPTYPSRLNIHP